MSPNLSTAEASRVIGLKEGRIRDLVRSGLCNPERRGHRYAFSFQDLVVLRAAKQLLSARIPARRVRSALLALSRDLPSEIPLSGVRVLTYGREVAVSDGRATWQPETGQTLLDFDRAADPEHQLDPEDLETARAAATPIGPAPAAGAEFAHALEIEGRDPAGARAAYNRALELDPNLVDAYVNLGRLEHEAGDAAEAVRIYEVALERSPDDPVIHFNLALALDDADGAAPAAVHYEEAITLDPDFADAHYNLAGLCEKLGRSADAVRHYHAYKRLTKA